MSAWGFLRSGTASNHSDGVLGFYPLMSYTFFKVVVLLLLTLYLGVGMFLGIHSPNQDVYPFSSWSLYHRVPNRLTEYAVRIHEYEGKKINPPVLFNKAGKYGMLIEEVSQTAYWKAIQRLGAAAEGNQREEILTRRAWLENNFRSPRLRYEVIKITYDPLEYWKTGSFQIIKSLGYFTPYQ